MSHKSVSKSNKYHADNMHKRSMTVGEYLERIEERRNAPARIIDGKMEVMLHGHWIDEKEFDELLPPPIVHSFNHDVTNIDSTKKWML